MASLAPPCVALNPEKRLDQILADSGTRRDGLNARGRAPAWPARSRGVGATQGRHAAARADRTVHAPYGAAAVGRGGPRVDRTDRPPRGRDRARHRPRLAAGPPGRAGDRCTAGASPAPRPGRRDGRVAQIDAGDLVPGDVLLLAKASGCRRMRGSRAATCRWTWRRWPGSPSRSTGAPVAAPPPHLRSTTTSCVSRARCASRAKPTPSSTRRDGDAASVSRRWR